MEESIFHLLKILEKEAAVVQNWFKNNEMKPNDDKCHLIVTKDSSNSTSKPHIYVGNECIESEKSVELLGIKIDNELKFNEHVTNLIKKGNQKLHALARISKFVGEDKLKLFMRTFIESQFNYCPLLWMFHSRELNHKINRLHKRALRVVYKNDQMTFEELLEKDKSYTIHERNLQKLAVEMYKAKHKLSPLPVQELFKQRDEVYNFRNKRCFEVPRVQNVSTGTETLRFRGIKTWDLVPDTIKESKSLAIFKGKIKNWKPNGCTCRLCKVYVHDLGFL